MKFPDQPSLLRFVALFLWSFFISVSTPAELSWRQEKDHRWAPLPQPSKGEHAFVQIPFSQSGVAFTNFLSELSLAKNRVLGNGSGVAVGDFDQDGLPDIFLCALESPSALFRNLGAWRFTNITAEVGLPNHPLTATGAVFADLDGDRDLDLLISTVHDGIRLFLNNSGRFTESASNLQANRGGTTLALADVDGNGSLDLYSTNYRTNDIRDRGRVILRNVGGKPEIPPEFKQRLLLRNGQVTEYGQPDQLFLNDGTGKFRPASWTDGTFLEADGRALTNSPQDWGLTATFRDVNGDLAPDLYVCNDYWTPDRFWINDGKGRFRHVPPLTLRKIPSSSMGVDFADLDRDGDLDFLAVDMLSSNPQWRKRQVVADKHAPPAIGLNDDLPQVFQNTLFLNRGDGTYAEAAYFAGLEATDWSWSPLFIDVDLDGFDDLLVTAGHFRDVQDMDAERQIRSRQHSWSGYTNEVARQEAYSRELMEHYRLYPLLQLPVRAYRNLGNLRFQETTPSWGFETKAVHHGMAFGDFDADGDLDLVVNSLNSSAEIYRNNATAPRIAVRLRGLPPNTHGIGAKLVFTNAHGLQQKEITAGGAYLSSSDPMAVFAPGVQSSNSLLIRWRNGKESRLENLSPNRLYEISEEASTSPASQPFTATNEPLFEDVSSSLVHTHVETPYDDYQRQPLLPFKLSQQGPAIAWFDIDDDSDDDLLIGSGAGGSPALYLNDGKGQFTPVQSPSQLVSRADYLGILGWKTETSPPRILAALSGYEAPQKSPLFDLILKDKTLTLAGTNNLPTNHLSASVLALGAFGSDSMALFVGGGVLRGKYPLPASSALLRLEQGEWKLDPRNTSLLQLPWIISSALWSDLTGEGNSELILACQWGPIRVFKIQNALLTDITDQLGLASFTGLWNGLATADVNADGQLDLIASNWGLNSPYSATLAKPLTLFYGEMVQPNRMDLIDAEWDLASNQLVPRRQLPIIGNSLPFVFQAISSYKQFSEASVVTLLGERHVLARQLTANTLASTLLLNRGGSFEPRELPREAQLAPAFSVNAADFNGDGALDLFLSQNFFAMHPEYPRQDAGRGLLLLGNGDGTFRPASSHDSGIKIYGEQRAAAVSDFNKDGRMDLVVSQNGAATKLFLNKRSNKGVRVILRGPSSNPAGIGAAVWIEEGGRKGPVQEVQAGSGYLAQDSAVKILAVPKQGSIVVRWPGGTTTATPVAPGSLEVKVSFDEKK